MTLEEVDTVSDDLFVGIISLTEFRNISESIKNKKDIALISIKDVNMPGFNQSLIRGYGDVIEVDFNDTTDVIDIPGYPPISEFKAYMIKKFILNNKDKKFLIHCMAGQSRSAGVGLAVECLIKYNGDKYLHQTSKSSIRDHKTNRYHPNLTVYDRILNEKND